MTRSHSPLVLIGYGDIARRLAERLPDREIVAVARRRPAPPPGHQGKWHGHPIDLDDGTPIPEEAVPAGSIWIYLAPPPRHGTVDPRVSHWLEGAMHAPAAAIYIGTTGVYGDHQGGWVDETTPPTPQHDRGRRRLDAERQFTDWCGQRGIPLTCLRVTGIYACDRLPVERIRAGAPVPRGDQAPWSNRVHADDLADILARLVERIDIGAPVTGSFNVSDNHPAPISEAYRQTAEHFRLPPPPQVDLDEVLAQASPMAREFLGESRRIDASAIQRALDWQPRYPDIAATLAACDKENGRSV
ncbi:NAD-dependent epimerase/dehydratase family protein [Guyparkeria sp.]|uniref:NAD-dependent epimerase/dehydratase family protein n=1 Tax=Guyparkeria sp. TaxID=2035736 RepID=UPI003970A68E